MLTSLLIPATVILTTGRLAESRTITLSLSLPLKKLIQALIVMFFITMLNYVSKVHM